MKVTLDHHYSPRIAEELTGRGIDVITARERAWHIVSDEELLTFCTLDERVLVTNNIADFMVLTRQWASEGRRHGGLIFTSDTRYPRTRSHIGRLVEAIEEFCITHPKACVDEVHWLT